MSEHETSERPEERWYLPTWGERVKLMGWRVIYFVPAMLLLVLLVVFPFGVLWWWKAVVVCVALPMGAAINAAHHAIRLRKEPFCIHCGYNMTGLPEGHMCPECGFAFHQAEMEDYQRDPHWFIKRQGLRGRLPPADGVFHAGPVKSGKRRDGT